jgi:hypothetical protein
MNNRGLKHNLWSPKAKMTVDYINGSCLCPTRAVLNKSFVS